MLSLAIFRVPRMYRQTGFVVFGDFSVFGKSITYLFSVPRGRSIPSLATIKTKVRPGHMGDTMYRMAALFTFLLRADLSWLNCLIGAAQFQNCLAQIEWSALEVKPAIPQRVYKHSSVDKSENPVLFQMPAELISVVTWA